MDCSLLSPYKESKESCNKKITVLEYKYKFQGNTACITAEYNMER